MSIYGNSLRQRRYVEESTSTEYKLSNGLYGNAMIDTSNPIVMANIIESDCLSFVKMMNNAGGMKYLTEADEGSNNKKSFKEKVRGIFNKIKEFVKKIWGKIVGFFKKIRDKIFRKKKEAANSSDASGSEGGAPGTLTISNYVTLAVNCATVVKNSTYLMGVLDEITVDEGDYKKVIDDIKRGEVTRAGAEEIAKAVEDEILSELKGADDTFKDMKISQYTKGAVSDDLTFDGPPSLASAMSAKFQEIHKYATENKIDLEVIKNSDGEWDFKSPIVADGYTYDRKGLSNKATVSLFAMLEHDAAKSNEYANKIYSEIEKRLNDSVKIVEKTIDEAKNNGELTSEMSTDAKYAINLTLSACSKHLPALSSIITTICSNYLKMVNNAVGNIDAMRSTLRI